LGAGIFSAETANRVADPTTVTGFRTVLGGVRLISDTNKIKAVSGGRFGVTFRFNGLIFDEVVHYKTVWTFPKSGLTNPVTGDRAFSEGQDRTCRIGAQCSVGWSFTEDWERVAGTWKLDIWLHGKLVATHSFEITVP
jgi:hypothetical protein